MNKEEFVTALSKRVRDNAAEYLYQDVLFNVENDYILFQPHTQQFSQIAAADSETNLPIVQGSNWKLIFDILIGETTLLDAFQTKQISTNGYLPQLFVLMIVFQPTKDTHIPE